MRRVIVVGAGIVALLSSVAPVGALSPTECQALQKQIARSRQLANTGGITLTAEIKSLRHAEENARTEMVRSGCNRKVNAGKPECQAIVARVHATAAERKAAEGSWRRSLQAGAAVDVADLTARYQAECLNPQPARNRHHQVPSRAETEAFGDMIIGLGILGTALSTSRMGRPAAGPRHVAPVPHRR
jgi:hypothetical protein